MKKAIIWLVLFPLVLLFVVPAGNAQSSERGPQTVQASIGADNIWKIKFSLPVDDQYLNGNYFQVLDSQMNQVNINITTQNDAQTVILTPQQNYTIGATYLLVVKSGVGSRTGKYLAQGVVKSFSVQANTSELPRVYSRENLLEILSHCQTRNVIFRSKGAIPAPASMADVNVKADESINAEADSTQGSGSTDYSSTNVQVEGVDEGDIVKTDGSNVYQIHQDEVIIGQIYPADQMRILSRFKLADENFSPRELYIGAGKLLVIGSSCSYGIRVNSKYKDQTTIYMSDYPHIINRYTTRVMVYDVGDPAQPALLHDTELDGNYLSSRKIGNYFYLLSNKGINCYPCDSSAKDEELLPYYRDSALNPDSFTSLDYKDIRYFPDSPEANYLLVAALNLSDTGQPVKVSAYLGSGQNIFVSDKNIYVAAVRYNYILKEKTGDKPADTAKAPAIMPGRPIYYNDSEDTALYRFSINEGNISYQASGMVPGTIINQFSMDEYQNCFRIATTKGYAWNNAADTSQNNVYILDQDLNINGRLEGLAPGEKIYSVRFMGERGYMVTFRTVDPLFVLDLKDPAQPVILGKLKIPGYSNYLHPYDSTHLLGFGKDTVELNGNAYYLGMKIALFDVSDIENPVEMSKVTIGDRGTDSDLLNNHKALLFNKDKNLLAFPVTLMKVDSAAMNKTADVYDTIPPYGSFAFQGAYVYSIDLQKGIQLRGTITHLDKNDYLASGSYGADTSKYIERLLYVGNSLYTFSQAQWQAHSLLDMGMENSLTIP